MRNERTWVRPCACYFLCLFLSCLLWCFAGALVESTRAVGAEYGAGDIALGCVLDGGGTLPAALSSALLRPQAATGITTATKAIAVRTRMLYCTDDS